ncbi:MAG TPA: hypothetical protein VG796_02945 [Verrucomicrobiales bacterium]|nr:hypothetical protein [Verrucomicrobiales bacterium]
MPAKSKQNTGSGFRQTLREAALRYPEAEEGIACKGTALECSAFKAGKKTFLFISGKEIRLKLGESLPEAGRLAAKEPHHYSAGSMGWVVVKFGSDESPPAGLLERWVEESYRMLVPKKLVAMLGESGEEARAKGPKKKGPKRRE